MKKSDIKNNNKEHVNVILGNFFFFASPGFFFNFYQGQGWYFYQQGKKCVFSLFHDWPLQRNSQYIHRWVFNTVSTSKARRGENADGTEPEK